MVATCDIAQINVQDIEVEPLIAVVTQIVVEVVAHLVTPLLAYVFDSVVE